MKRKTEINFENTGFGTDVGYALAVEQFGQLTKGKRNGEFKTASGKRVIITCRRIIVG